MKTFFRPSCFSPSCDVSLTLQGLLSESDVERAVDHLNRLILEEDDNKVGLDEGQSTHTLKPKIFQNIIAFLIETTCGFIQLNE